MRSDMAIEAIGRTVRRLRESLATPASFRRVTIDQVKPLTNDGWGVTSNCFVCEERNDAGLGIRFHHDLGRDLVVATFSLDDRFSGAPRYLHGGVSLAILDEAMAWAAIAIAGKFVVTQETTSRFERPVMVGREHCVHAWIIGGDDRQVRTFGEILDCDGNQCVIAEATFAVLDLEQATEAAGAEVGEEATRYLTSR